MLLENVRVLTPEGVFRKGSVEYGEKIGRVHTYDDCGLEPLPYLIPGLVEIHSHGAMLCDHSNGDADGMARMASYYAENGVTSFLATTMTHPEEKILRAMQAAGESQLGNGARCVGVNMEGPFLSHEKKGAHMAEMLRKPDIAWFEKLYAASGESIRLVSVAPEVEGAMEFIRAVCCYCKVALAHTASDYDTAILAFESGATHVTHLFNAMNPFLHRDPGIIGAAMDAGAYVEVISDGIHLHPAVVRAAYKMFDDKLCMISDSISSAGMPDGKYESGGMPVIVTGGKATLESGTIAGSNISLMDGVRHAVAFGIPLEKAVMAATRTNACAVGLEGQVGTIVPGAWADMVMLDSDLKIIKVIINGREYSASQ